MRATAPLLDEAFEAPASSNDELLQQASIAIGMLISQQLAGTSFGIEAACHESYDNAPGNFVFSPAPPTLLGWAYFQLATLLVERQPMMTCEGCERIFVRRDPRQTFCEPACSARYRNRKKYDIDRGRMNANELLSEFRRLGATVGDHDGQPGSFIQEGLGIVLRVNGRMLSLDEAHEYLRQLRAGTEQP